MSRFLRGFIADEAGVTAMEYGMIAALIAVAILATLGLLGKELNTTFTKIEEELAKANGAK